MTGYGVPMFAESYRVPNCRLTSSFCHGRRHLHWRLFRRRFDQQYCGTRFNAATQTLQYSSTGTTDVLPDTYETNSQPRKPPALLRSCLCHAPWITRFDRVVNLATTGCP